MNNGAGPAGDRSFGAAVPVEAPPDGWNPVDGRSMYDAYLGGQRDSLDAEEAASQDRFDDDESAQVTTAFIDPLDIKGEVFLNEVTFAIASKETAAKVFGESGETTFEVVLHLTLPKGTTLLKGKDKYEGIADTRVNDQGQRITNNTTLIGGSIVIARRGSENNFRTGADNAGPVIFKDVDLKNRTATAVFKVSNRRGYTEGYSNSLDVVIKGEANKHGFTTKIRVTIQPPK
jgi:hypothetical protein